MPNTITSGDWDSLLRRIRNKKWTPFIGAGASAGAVPLAKDIASEWASDYKYPLVDSHNLARVAQFLAVERDDMFPKEDIQRRLENIKKPDFSDKNEPHRLLADLQLPIYITTNYDGLMAEALRNRGTEPVIERCRWNRFVETALDRSISRMKAVFWNSPASAASLLGGI